MVVEPPAPAVAAIQPHLVAAAHNQMAAEYDRLDDLWYPWLFSQIHAFVAKGLKWQPRRRRALDAGCGTGFQSFLLAQAGFDEVEGFDIAEDLLEVARRKIPAFAVPPLEAPPLFSSSHAPRWLTRAHASLARSLDGRRDGKPVRAPVFTGADLTTADFGAAADVIACCGSVLSFVDRYEDVLRRPGIASPPSAAADEPRVPTEDRAFACVALFEALVSARTLRDRSPADDPTLATGRVVDLARQRVADELRVELKREVDRTHDFTPRRRFYDSSDDLYHIISLRRRIVDPIAILAVAILLGWGAGESRAIEAAIGPRGSTILRTVVVLAGAVTVVLGALGMSVRDLLNRPRKLQSPGD